MGSPDFALPTLSHLASLYNLVGVITQPDRPAGRGRKEQPCEVKKLAEAEYFAGGSDTALSILGKMTDNERDAYIKRLVKENVAVGIEIIMRGGN